MNFFKSIIESVIKARKRQAAFTIAQHLKETNKDFRDVAFGDLVNRIMDEDNPTHINGTPAK